MLVGEAPGKTEIDTHIPFSGQAGKELMQALSSTGLTREDVYITSAVRSRPYRVTHRINKRTQQTETVYPNRTPTRLRTDGNPAKINCDTWKYWPATITW